MTELEKSLLLSPTRENEWRAVADPAFEANTGMFGGWTAALMLKAALSLPKVGAPAALTVNFVSRIDSGTTISVRACELGGGRSITHRRVEISNLDGAVCAAASVVFARRRDNTGFVEGVFPEAPPPETLPEFHPPGSFGQSVDVRPIFGFPPVNQKNTRSASWLRVMDDAPLSPVRLAFLADVAPPRIWYVGAAPRPSSTITMSVYFLGADAELADAGNNYLLSEVTGIRAHGSVFSDAMRLWSGSGALLATSEQLCWFR